MQIDYEKIALALKKMTEAFRHIVDSFKQKWEAIKEFFSSYQPRYKEPIHPAVKGKVTKQSIHSQVMRRKPRIMRARTSC